MKRLALLALDFHNLPAAVLNLPAAQEVVPPSATLGAAELPPTPQATPVTGRVGHVRRP